MAQKIFMLNTENNNLLLYIRCCRTIYLANPALYIKEKERRPVLSSMEQKIHNRLQIAKISRDNTRVIYPPVHQERIKVKPRLVSQSSSPKPRRTSPPRITEENEDDDDSSLEYQYSVDVIQILSTLFSIVSLIVSVLIAVGVIKTTPSTSGAESICNACEYPDPVEITADQLDTDTIPAICNSCSHPIPENIAMAQFAASTVPGICEECTPSGINISQLANETVVSVCDICRNFNISTEQIHNDTVDDICIFCLAGELNLTVSNATKENVCGYCTHPLPTNISLDQISSEAVDTLCETCRDFNISTNQLRNDTIDSVCMVCVEGELDITVSNTTKQDVCDFCEHPAPENIEISQLSNISDICVACTPYNISSDQISPQASSFICDGCPDRNITLDHLPLDEICGQCTSSIQLAYYKTDSEPCNCSTDLGEENACNTTESTMKWHDTTTNLEYFCNSNVGQWWSSAEHERWGERGGSACDNGNDQGNDAGCSVTYGGGITALLGSTKGLYLPWDIVITSVSYEDGGSVDSSCSGGSDSIEIEIYTGDENGLSFHATLASQVSDSYYQSGSLLVGVQGDQMISLGIANSCGLLTTINNYTIRITFRKTPTYYA